MALFGKMFEKKVCSICGGEIGLLGNRKLEDGNCCKECARKLSPWFEDRRSSTVAQINEQLAYRAENEKKLASFRVTQAIGDYYKLYVEEVNGVPSRFFVTSADDYMSANPDIVEFKDLLSCTTDIRTREEELKQKDANGNDVSYNPPRYETEYDFYINMQIGNNPYFSEMSFKINSRTVTLETRGASTGSFLGLTLSSGPVNVSDPREQSRHQEYTAMCQQIEYVVQRSRMSPQQAAAAYQQPVAGYQQPVAGYQQPVAGYQQPVAGYQQPVAGYQQPVAGYQQPVAGYQQPVAGYQQPVAGYQQPVAGYQQPVAGYQQPVAAPQATGAKFCPNCGAAMNGGNFCQNCGSRL